MEQLQIFALATGVSAMFTLLALKIFPFFRLLDFPERYGLKRKPIPYPGGLIFLLLSFGILYFDAKFLVLVPAILGLGILSFWDDRQPISAYFRILLHICIAAGIFFAGIRINFIGNPFQATNFELAGYPLISFILTVGWIIAVQNAMNWFDGIRGLAVGVSGVGFLTLGILGLIRPELFFDPTHMSLTMANFFLAGCCAGGFWWFLRGKIILGDTGSQVLGFLLAGMAIFSGAKIATTLLVLGLPILDAIFVVLRRIFWDKKSPIKGDLFHLHHNLAQIIGEREASIFLIFLSALFGGGAIFLFGMEKLIAIGIMTIFVFGLCIWTYKKATKN